MNSLNLFAGVHWYKPDSVRILKRPKPISVLTVQCPRNEKQVRSQRFNISWGRRLHVLNCTSYIRTIIVSLCILHMRFLHSLLLKIRPITLTRLIIQSGRFYQSLTVRSSSKREFSFNANKTKRVSIDTTTL